MSYVSTNSGFSLSRKINDYLAAYLDAQYAAALRDNASAVNLQDITEILSGGTPKTKVAEYWEHGNVPFFGPGDARQSVYCMETEKHITSLGLNNCNSDLYPTDTVFLTARGTVGKVAMAGVPMAMNQSCFAFRGKDVAQSVIYQIIKRAVRSLQAKANGATFAAINTRDLKAETVVLPSRTAIKSFERKALSIHEEMRTNEIESMHLTSLRDTLLPKLMSGEIDVSKIGLTQSTNNHLYVFVYEIPSAAVRELIINALAHRSYVDHSSIQVAVYDNRLEVTSPGRLPMGQTIERMKQGYSRIRNEGLASAFEYMGLIEHWGSGILRIM